MKTNYSSLFFMIALTICSVMKHLNVNAQIVQNKNISTSSGLIVSAKNKQYLDISKSKDIIINGTVSAQNQKFYNPVKTKYLWEKLSGPACVMINSDKKDVKVKFIREGKYTFKFSASNGFLFGSDIVNVYVISGTPKLNTSIDSTQSRFSSNYDSSRMLLPGWTIKGRVSLSNYSPINLTYPLCVNLKYLSFDKETGVRVDNVVSGPTSIVINENDYKQDFYLKVNSVTSKTYFQIKAWIIDSVSEINDNTTGFFLIYPSGSGIMNESSTPCANQQVSIIAPSIVYEHEIVNIGASLTCTRGREEVVYLSSSHPGLLIVPNNGIITLPSGQGESGYALPIRVSATGANLIVTLTATIANTNPPITVSKQVILSNSRKNN